MERGPRTTALPSGVRNIVEAFLYSPIAGPQPRLGTLIDNQTVEIPHFFRKATREIVANVHANAGDRVVVYNSH